MALQCELSENLKKGDAAAADKYTKSASQNAKVSRLFLTVSAHNSFVRVKELD